MKKADAYKILLYSLGHYNSIVLVTTDSALMADKALEIFREVLREAPVLSKVFRERETASENRRRFRIEGNEDWGINIITVRGKDDIMGYIREHVFYFPIDNGGGPDIVRICKTHYTEITPTEGA